MDALNRFLNAYLSSKMNRSSSHYDDELFNNNISNSNSLSKITNADSLSNVIDIEFEVTDVEDKDEENDTNDSDDFTVVKLIDMLETISECQKLLDKFNKADPKIISKVSEIVNFITSRLHHFVSNCDDDKYKSKIMQIAIDFNETTLYIIKTAISNELDPFAIDYEVISEMSDNIIAAINVIVENEGVEELENHIKDIIIKSKNNE